MGKTKPKFQGALFIYGQPKVSKSGNEYFTGKMTDDQGIEYGISAFIRESKAGNKYISFLADEFKKTETEGTGTPAIPKQDDISEIPF